MRTNTEGARREESGEGDQQDHSSVSADATENLWATEQRALLRGLAHALSNRVGTIVAASGMLAPDAPAPGAIVTMLRDEADRLEALLALVRLLAGDASDDEPELLHLPDVVGPAVALHAQHPDWRDVRVTVTPDPGAPPVRVAPAQLLRALLVRLSMEKARTPSGVTLAWSRDGAHVVVRVGDAGALTLPALA